MKIGLQLVWFHEWPGGADGLRAMLATIAEKAEHASFASIWMLDHLFQMEGAGDIRDPMLESYTSLAYLAAITKRVQLGTLVTGVVYRYPGYLVKTVTTLDVLSGGRAYLGIGAAWYEREARGLGIPFPPLAQRFEMLEETLQIAHQMWAGEVKPFHGKHYQLAETINSPQAVSKPRPKILVGGMGEQKTLRLVAQYADACNFDFVIGDDALRHKLDVLRRHCDAVGRNYDEIEKTAVGGVDFRGGTRPEDVINRCRALADLGFSHVMFNLRNVHEITPLETFGREIIPVVNGF